MVVLFLDGDKKNFSVENLNLKLRTKGVTVDVEESVVDLCSIGKAVYDAHAWERRQDGRVSRRENGDRLYLHREIAKKSTGEVLAKDDLVLFKDKNHKNFKAENLKVQWSRGTSIMFFWVSAWGQPKKTRYGGYFTAEKEFAYKDARLYSLCWKVLADDGSEVERRAYNLEEYQKKPWMVSKYGTEVDEDLVRAEMVKEFMSTVVRHRCGVVASAKLAYNVAILKHELFKAQGLVRENMKEYLWKLQMVCITEASGSKTPDVLHLELFGEAVNIYSTTYGLLDCVSKCFLELKKRGVVRLAKRQGDHTAAAAEDTP